MERLNNLESTEELLEKMDAALAALPLDFEAYGTDYQQKAGILSELHQYAEGTYTILSNSGSRSILYRSGTVRASDVDV